MAGNYLIAYLEILGLCFIICAIFLVKVSRDMGSEREVRTFKWMLRIFMIMLVIDSFTQMHYKEAIRLPIPFLSFLYSCYMLMLGLLAIIWLYYAEQRIDRPISHSRRFWIAMIAPFIVYGVICFASIKTRWMYDFDSNGIYMRGPLFVLQNVFAYFYFMFSGLHALILGIRERVGTRRSMLFQLASFLIAPMLAGSLQLVVGGYPFVAAGICLATVFIFVNIQSDLVSVDSLTGLNNRRRSELFFEDLRQYASSQTPFYLFMMDLDRFKLINDSFGHLEGDRALQIVAEALRRLDGEYHGFSARYGGDEFLTIIRGEDINRPEEFAEKLSFYLKLLCRERESQYQLSASVGWASCTDPGTPLSDLIADADNMLYRNKEIKAGAAHII